MPASTSRSRSFTFARYAERRRSSSTASPMDLFSLDQLIVMHRYHRARWVHSPMTAQELAAALAALTGIPYRRSGRHTTWQRRRRIIWRVRP
jgi:hypothetical protein